jgi:hypothetical protein
MKFAIRSEWKETGTRWGPIGLIDAGSRESCFHFELHWTGIAQHGVLTLGIIETRIEKSAVQYARRSLL